MKSRRYVHIYEIRYIDIYKPREPGDAPGFFMIDLIGLIGAQGINAYNRQPLYGCISIVDQRITNKTISLH